MSRLYRIPGVDWLLAEQEQFSSTTTLRHADLNGLPQDNTFGPLNTRSLTDVRQRARELTPPARRGKFQAENKPNNKHHKMYRQFAKPPGQTPGEYSRDYPRTTTVDGDDQRYGKMKAPIEGCKVSDRSQFRLSLYAPFSLSARRDFLDGTYIGLGTGNRHDDKCTKGGQHGAAGDSGCRLK